MTAARMKKNETKSDLGDNIFLESISNDARAKDITVYTAPSALAPTTIKNERVAIPLRIQRWDAFFALITPRCALKNITIPKNDQLEGFVLAIRKIPSGSVEINNPKIGIRRRCWGSEIIRSARQNTARIELKTLIAMVEAAKSSVANQLIVQ
jgi:hypothetical protein